VVGDFMAYLGKKERMNKELLDIFNKKPIYTSIERERLQAELQIHYGISEATAKETLSAFIKTGRLTIQ
jgi:hypothetical protein